MSARSLLHRLGIPTQFKQKKKVYCSWFKPQDDFVKLNSNGSVMVARNGFGGVLRDKNGEVLLSYTGASKEKSVLVQELRGVLSSLKGRNLLQQRKVIVVVDSLMAVTILQRKMEPPWYCQNMVGEIRYYEGILETVVYKHVYRESNKVADYLASLENVLGVNYFVGPLDSNMSVLVRNDTAGSIYLRH